MKRVFLIDSMSHIFRAFFAPMGMRQEPMRNSKGQVTQAVFVFTNMLRKLLNDEKPDYVAAVFDTAAPTFRHDSFDAYKANREAMPDDLASQLPFIVRVCEAFNIPILKMDGFEADDIIGTLANECAAKGMQAVIVSNDKDLCQLVRDPYVVAMRQNSQNLKRKVPVPPIEWCDEAWVKNKFGLPPDKIVDLLGLMGDAVDNIPGAPGIGEKGALKLVLEYGSALGAMENAEKITHKTYRESLQNNQDIIRQSLELATVHTSVPISLDIEALKAQKPNRDLAYELFRELEFKTLTNEFSGPDTASRIKAATSSDGGLFDTQPRNSSDVSSKYLVVNSSSLLDEMIGRLIETPQWSFHVNDSNANEKASCFEKPAPHGIGFGLGNGEAFYVDLDGFAGGRIEALRQLNYILTSENYIKSVYDEKRNFGSLLGLGIRPAGVKDDVLIAAYLLESTRTSYPIPFLAQIYSDIDAQHTVPEGFDEAAFRTAENADFVARLAPILSERLRENSLETLYKDVELPLIPILIDIELTGMKIDGESLTIFSEFISKELESLREKITTIAGREFNIGSPKQVGEIFSELNIETGRKTATGQISTSHDVLVELAETYEIAQHIIDYRELDKLRATYADALPKMIASDGRIHGCLNQTVAATGRLSSTEPNLQNIPVRTELGQRIRKAFIPEAGNKLISADYSQLELRILAHITRDPRMLEAYKNNEDIHSQTARLVFGAKDEKELKEKRRLAKIVNFGIAYAVEAFGLSQRVGISRSEAKQVIADYFETYKGIREYMDRTPLEAREKGYITSLFGRRRHFPSINDRNFAVRSRAEREAINMPIQGTASDIVKIAMIRVAAALKAEKLATKMIMQVHDELLFEGPASEVDAAKVLIKREMESAATLDVPLVVEIGVGDDWMSAK
ncbi:MAG TPA: DNA polymerase I [Pyrinomonadaceae bacterium]|nr:DNA polymerase I [Chloracidobacterium sp.]MBP9108924.1 DNA polymerase I [Pyrinomonadaceae bacterium]MBK7802934.1 DNA polymerase I [Chloracidobacterium sp.]MBK9438419.1 DNA polymerase I [Chloracidobacterium sp.]MBL0240700.1 DNA polymerase I [Chloracidobacterium sp.]